MDRSGARMALVLTAALGLATLLSGCGGLAAPTPEPSLACMGFNLTVFNGIDATVEVRVNGVVADTVEAGRDTTIFETMLAARTEMPWTVEFVDQASGATLGTRIVSREAGQESAWIDVERGPGGSPSVGGVNGRAGC